jgi:hypothetical protein
LKIKKEKPGWRMPGFSHNMGAPELLTGSETLLLPIFRIAQCAKNYFTNGAGMGMTGFPYTVLQRTPPEI